ncbi:MAG: hypothetical protein N2652_04740 [Kiritimatiellae bacterium]|nr:hypothetical protein [Kiritimatiellia bacterium]
MKRAPHLIGTLGAALISLGCEAVDEGGSERLVSREVLQDGSVRSVYEEPAVTAAGAPAVRRTTVVEPPAGEPTTNIVVTPVSGIVSGEPTNTPPSTAMPTLPGLPPGATPLPPAP